MPRGCFSRARECTYGWRPSREFEMHIHHARKAAATSWAIPIPATVSSPDRRRLLQILLAGSLAAASLAIIGCATTTGETPPTSRRRVGNRGGGSGKQ